MENLSEDIVRDNAKIILGFDENEKNVQQGTGQLTTFKKLGFSSDYKPDGRYLPKDIGKVAIIFEAKSSDKNLYDKKREEELFRNVKVVQEKYKSVVGILYNGNDIRVFKNNVEVENISKKLENKSYYFKLFTDSKIDTQLIFNLTKQINDSLHFQFGIKNLYHRMIFTACALVAKRYDAILVKGMTYDVFKSSILSKLQEVLREDKKKNPKLDYLCKIYSSIEMNSESNQEAIDNFIECVSKISDCVNSDNWNGEDVMGIFFNEFNRYKGKAQSGQVFTPDHITSLTYRLIDINQNDVILDAACGSGAFLVKSMCNMIKESGGNDTAKAKEIKSKQLYGIEFDKEIFALACANMLIHKDGKTNLEQLDSRTVEACEWIKSKPITKVLMNPPFENKYGCMTIVKNVLDNVPYGTKCAFILPDKKLEKVSSAKKLLNNHKLEKIIKLPEKVFFEGITTSVFIFTAGIPQNGEEIFGCYIEDDGLETVKNQGRQDIKGRWEEIENYRVNAIKKQNDEKYHTAQRINPSENLSYQMPKKEFEIIEEDFEKTVMDYLMFEEGIDVKEFKVGDLFDIHPTKAYKDTNKDLFEEDGKNPVVVNSGFNNGIGGYTNKDCTEKAGTITFTDTAAKSSESFFYQDKDFVGYPHVQGMYPKGHQWNKQESLFLTSSIKAAIKGRYDFIKKMTRDEILKLNIKLPVDNDGNPNRDFMENYIKNLVEKNKKKLNCLNS